MKTLAVDIETFSSVNLLESGVYAYCQAPDFTILLLAYAFDNEEVKVVDLAQGEQLPSEVVIALTSDDVIKTAYNANFERTCLNKYLNKEMPPEQWRCTAVHALMLGLPGNLDGVCKALGFDEEIAKGKTGRLLIQYFSIPCKPTKRNGERRRNLSEHDIDKWDLFKDYCKQDVVAERAIRQRLSIFPVPQREQELWELDQKINDRGILLDMEMVQTIIHHDTTYQEELLEEARAITGLDNPNSVSQLKDWLTEQGIKVHSLNKETVKNLVSTSTGDVKRVLKLRQAMSKTSTKKYQAMERAVCLDGRVRGCLRFYGANRTGRWAGRLVQVHNLPQNKIPDIELARELVRENEFDLVEQFFGETSFVLSQLIRTAFIPSVGCRFIISDFSAIEARVIAWLANEEWRIEVFNSHGKIYEASASKMFNVALETITKESPLRQKGKVAELACIAEGELVLTNEGLIPIQEIELRHRLWDGRQWVSHDGVIYKGEQEVITYDGLTATEDHLVWVEGKSEPVRFEKAASSGAHLLQTGNGRQTIWVGENNKPRKKVEQKLESLQSINPMCKLFSNTVDKFKQSSKRGIQRLPKMFTATANSIMVGQTINCCKAKVRKPKRCWLCKLWRTRNRVQIPISNRSRALDYRKCRKCVQRTRTRQDRFKWPLRTWKPQICTKKHQPRQQKNNCIIRMGSEILAVCKDSSNKNVITRNDARRNHSIGGISSRTEKKKLEKNSCKISVYDIRNAGPRNRFTVSNKLVHNCGFGGGVGALRAMGAGDMGLTDDELQLLITDWRASNPNIVKLWGICERAARKAISEKTPVRINRDIIFSYENGILFIRLPSGRRLAYYNAKIILNSNGRTSITYSGIESQSKRWGTLQTYGGKLVENIVQAIARDCLAEAMKRLDRAGYTIVMHVHDEVVLDVPTEQDDADKITKIMSMQIQWAKGLPLKADTYETPFYRKD